MVATNETADDVQRADPLENWFLLMDPQWRPKAENEAPPIEAIVGVWPVEDGGRLGKFRANPDYVPADEKSPSDPLDTVLRLAQQGRAGTEQIQLLMRDTFFDLALNEDGKPLITKSPDDVLCVVLATSEPHRGRLNAPAWRRLDLEELVELLADDVDVLLNPAGPAAVRLTGDFMRETLILDDEELAAIQPDFGQAGAELRVVPWDLDASGDLEPKDD